MKSIQLAIASFVLIAFVIGCKPASEPPGIETRQTTERELDQVQQEVNEATQAMNDYAYAQKSDYVATRQADLAEINRELDQLAARIENANDAARTEATPKLQALRDQVAKLNTHLGEAKNATDSNWDDVKAGFNQGYNDLKDGLNQARQWVSEKVAP